MVRARRQPALATGSVPRPARCSATLMTVDPDLAQAGLPVPDPALVVLVGASGAGKTTWAAERYLAMEIVSSDRLRAVVGSGEHDLDASVDAFSLLDQIVT